MMATVAEVIIQKLVDAGVTRSFGYPGSLAGYVMDALRQAEEKSILENKTLLTEQACSFAAIGAAQVSNKPTLCWSTSGPGATNLLTGIAAAFYDSIPVIFLTSNVSVQDSREALGDLKLRQNGNQETDIVSMAAPVTKFAARATTAKEALEIADKAISAALSGRKGPVLLDLPISVAKLEVEEEVGKKGDSRKEGQPEESEKSSVEKEITEYRAMRLIEDAIGEAKNPVLILGGGVIDDGVVEKILDWTGELEYPNIKRLKIAFTMRSLECKNLLHSPRFAQFGCGFAWANYWSERMNNNKEQSYICSSEILDVLGVWGGGKANEAIKQSDLVISFGSRLSNRQLAPFGGKFPDGVSVIRVDYDEAEFSRQITNNPEDTIDILADLKDLFDPSVPKAIALTRQYRPYPYQITMEYTRVITADVGQNMWRICREFNPGLSDKVIFSAGAGCMGASLPTAIGAVNAMPSNLSDSRLKAFAFCGDGGLQMSLENLNYISQNNLPICVILYNNSSLGLIKAFQDRNFKSSFFSTTSESGYSSISNWKKLAETLGFTYFKTNETDPNKLIKFAHDKANPTNKLKEHFSYHSYWRRTLFSKIEDIMAFAETKLKQSETKLKQVKTPIFIEVKTDCTYPK